MVDFDYEAIFKQAESKEFSELLDKPRTSWAELSWTTGNRRIDRAINGLIQDNIQVEDIQRRMVQPLETIEEGGFLKIKSGWDSLKVLVTNAAGDFLVVQNIEEIARLLHGYRRAGAISDVHFLHNVAVRKLSGPTFRVGGVSLEVLREENLKKGFGEAKLGAYFDYCFGLFMAQFDSGVRERLVEQIGLENPEFKQGDQENYLNLSGAVMAGLAVSNFFSADDFLGDDRMKTLLMRKANDLVDRVREVGGSSLRAIVEPKSRDFRDVSGRVSRYFGESQTVHFGMLHFLSNGDVQDEIGLFRYAQKFCEEGVETEFYRGVSRMIRDLAENEEVNNDRWLTEGSIRRLVAGSEAGKKVTPEEIVDQAKRVRTLSRSLNFELPADQIGSLGLTRPFEFSVYIGDDPSRKVEVLFSFIEEEKTILLPVNISLREVPGHLSWLAIPRPEEMPGERDAVMGAIARALSIIEGDLRQKRPTGGVNLNGQRVVGNQVKEGKKDRDLGRAKVMVDEKEMRRRGLGEKREAVGSLVDRVNSGKTPLVRLIAPGIGQDYYYASADGQTLVVQKVAPNTFVPVDCGQISVILKKLGRR